MNKLITLLALFCLVIATSCQDDQPEAKLPTDTQIALKFDVNGEAKTVVALRRYDGALGRFTLLSDEIVERVALDEKTKKVIYVYCLKETIENGRSQLVPSDQPGTKKTGYYGYSEGCYYYGTLWTANDGSEYFQIATGINSVLNPPLCPGGQWA